MNTYCDLCANKDHKETCRTCVSGILRTTTDGAVYSLPSNYSRVFKPIVPSLDADALKATINKRFGTGLAVSPYQKAMSKIKNVIFNGPAMAISKYFFDNAGYFNDVFKKWIPKKGESDEKDQ